jgi:glycosyltransferase involved in cell wall biosynthesis
MTAFTLPGFGLGLPEAARGPVVGKLPSSRATVYVNGRFLTQRVTGVQRYAHEVLLALDALLAEEPERADFTLEVLAPEGTVFPTLRAIRTRSVGPFAGNLWEQFTLPAVVRGAPLFSFSATGPLFKTTQVVTVHDASIFAVPQAFSWRFRAWYKLLLAVLLRRAVGVVTVSEFSRREIAHHFGCGSEKLRVATEGWQHVVRPAADPKILTKHALLPHRYVLAVSSPTPNKNFALVVEALKRLQHTSFDVVIAGSADRDVLRGSLPESVRIKYVGYVSDAELRALYEHAGVFVYPSLYEGFGIPVLEAMACGCPVIASTAASLPEVCGDAALYVSPHDGAALATAIARVMSDEVERQRLVRAGRQRIGCFSWALAAEKNLAFMRHLVEASSEATRA